tara:strand:+ start:4410 stop:4820 length:411 start_codon:yes stop_codon:yes gene_type:complete
MNATQEKDSQFIYADDLIRKGVWSEAEVEITEVIAPGGLKYGNGRVSSKFAIRIKGKGKCWEMPTTQFRLIRMGLGRDLKKWIGKKITLYPAWGKTPFGKGPFIRSRPLCPIYQVPGGVQQQMGNDLTGDKLGQEI